MKQSSGVEGTIVKVKKSHNWLKRDCYFTGVKDGEIYAAIDNTQITPEDHDLLYKRGFIRWASQLECQDVINQEGCSWFTIRLDATKYKPRDSHQKTWRRWKRFLKGERNLKDLNKLPTSMSWATSEGEVSVESPRKTKEAEAKADNEENTEACSRFEAASTSIKQHITDHWDSLIKLVTASCSPEAIKKVGNDFFSKLHDKVAISHDKKDDRIAFTNCLVIAAYGLSIDPHQFVKSNMAELETLISLPNFIAEVMPSGILRWTPIGLKPRPAKPKILIKQPSVAIEKPKPRVLEIKWTPLEYSEEAYELYKLYSDTFQNSYGTSREYFRENIIRNDIIARDEVSAIDGSVLKLGNRLMKYYLDGELVAMSALDVIPTGICGAFFMYHPKLRSLKIEVVSAMYEIEFIKTMNKSFPAFKYSSLGHYIPQTKSSNYKHDYQPSELKCPLTGRYVLLTPAMIEQVAAGRKVLDEEDYPESERLRHEFRDVDDIYQTLLEHGRLLHHGEVRQFNDSTSSRDILKSFVSDMTTVLMCLGREMSKRVVFDFDS